MSISSEFDFGREASRLAEAPKLNTKVGQILLVWVQLLRTVFSADHHHEEHRLGQPLIPRHHFKNRYPTYGHIEPHSTTMIVKFLETVLNGSIQSA